MSRSRRFEVRLAFLPAYAPEFGPAEYVWGYAKQHEFPNFCPKDSAHLSRYARGRLGSMQRRAQFVVAFCQQVELPFGDVSQLVNPP